jgi:hypothetical protein
MKIPLFLPVLLCATAFACAQESFGTIRATTKMRPDGSTSTTIVDPDKRTAEETISNGAGKVLRKTTYLLGDDEKSIGAIFADGAGKVIYKVSYQRDSAGRVAESSFSSPDGRHLGKRVFRYGMGETVTGVEDYDAAGKLLAKPQAATKPGAPKKRR